MRLKASLGFLLLGLGACTHLPGIVRIDVDGSTLEFKKDPITSAPEPQPQLQPPAPEPAPPAADDQPR